MCYCVPGQFFSEHRLHHAIFCIWHSNISFHCRWRNLFPGPGKNNYFEALTFMPLALWKSIFQEQANIVKVNSWVTKSSSLLSCFLRGNAILSCTCFMLKAIKTWAEFYFLLLTWSSHWKIVPKPAFYKSHLLISSVKFTCPSVDSFLSLFCFGVSS